MSFHPRFVLASLALLGFGLTAHAASPQLTRILPRGAQRGAELQLTFVGQRLEDAREVLVYQPGVTVTKVEQPTDKKDAGKQVKVTVKVDKNARVGEYDVRLRTATGLSELKSFWVGRLPVVDEKEPNSDYKQPQPIGLNLTVAGVVENEDQDFFVVEAKKGQRLTAEIEGMRLGEFAFDPFLAILDENRFELASNDDNALLKQDAIVSIVAPKDGKYVIQLRDSAFGGSGSAFYRLHVGTFPRPRVVYPLGGQTGQTVKVTYLGDVLGPVTADVKLPGKPDDHFELYCEQDALASPSPNHFRVSDFPSVNEVEPNETVKQATPHAGTAPVAFNGVIAAAPASQGDATKTNQDADYFKFTARKGQVLDVNVFARRLRSPLDPLLTIYNANGGQVAANDDAGGPDAYLRFTAPADGDYFARVRDHLRGGGDQYAYRIEITPVRPAVSMTIPQYTPNYSQERQAVTVPKANRYATLLRVTRQDVGGPLKVDCPDLPAGVKMTVANLEPGVDTVPALFEADPDAQIAGKLVQLNASPADKPAADKPADPAPFTSGFRQLVELVTNGNQAPYYTIAVDRMAVAVAEEAPFTLQIVEPKVPLVKGGTMNLKITAQRKDGFKGPINVRMLWKPPGVEAAANVEMPADKSEILYPVNASDGAAAQKWKLVVLGSTDSGGTVWAASPYAQVEVVPQFLTAKITNASVEQGQPVTMTADLTVATKWDGKAKVELVGLPGNTTAPTKEITADDTKIEFPVQTAANTPASNHKGLFLRVTLTQNGEPIVHNIARGAALRINAPLPRKDDKTAKDAAPNKDAKDPKPKPAAPATADKKPAPAPAARTPATKPAK